MYKNYFPAHKAGFLFFAFFLIQYNFAALDPHAHMHAFHENLVATHPEWFRDGVQAFYKEIDPVTSNPEVGENKWDFHAVTIAGQKALLRGDGTFSIQHPLYGNISVQINPFFDFDQTHMLHLVVTRNNEAEHVACVKTFEEKVAALPQIESYNELLNKAHQNQLSWVHRIFLEGALPILGENDCTIKIAGAKKYNPLVIRGMEITYSKNLAKTNIFFDCVDSRNEFVGGLMPTICDHRQAGPDRAVFRVKAHKLYECSARDITYELFDSVITRNRWVLDVNGFYDQNKKVWTVLPSVYSNLNNHPEIPAEQSVWFFEEDLGGFYEFDGPKNLQDISEYLYCAGNGSLFATLPYQVTFKEYLAEQNKIPLHYLEVVEGSSLSVHRDARIEGGRFDWRKGIYKKNNRNNEVVWQMVWGEAGVNVNDEEKDIIQYHDDVPCQQGVRGAKFSMKLPDASVEITVQQTKRWCDAAQRFFIAFGTKVHQCDRDLVRRLGTWSNITSLNASDLRLENGQTLTEVVNGIGAMPQLTELRFCNNSPVTHFNGLYEKLANRASDYYVELGARLRLLRNLRELHIQGLWLNRHELLGTGMEGDRPSIEVAALTGIMNHRSRRGVGAIINSVCALEHLETLSIDGIATRGSSWFDRQTLFGKGVAVGVSSYCGSYPGYLALFALAGIDEHWQNENLNHLSTSSAISLAQKPVLRSINVYSTGGNCAEYFSREFKQCIIASRRAGLPPLIVRDATLGDNPETIFDCYSK